MANKMAVYQNTVTDGEGNIVPFAPVEVRSHAAGNPLIALFEDRTGLVTKINGFTADADGFFRFYAIGGAYKVTATVDGEDRELDHVAVGTAAEYDARDLLFAVLMQFQASGKASAALPLMPFDVILPVTLFAADKTSWIAKVRTAPNADRVISLVKNAVQFATVTFLNGVTTGVFAMASDVDLVFGDQVWAIMPSPADTVMTDFSMTMVARR